MKNTKFDPSSAEKTALIQRLISQNLGEGSVTQNCSCFENCGNSECKVDKCGMNCSISKCRDLCKQTCYVCKADCVSTCGPIIV